MRNNIDLNDGDSIPSFPLCVFNENIQERYDELLMNTSKENLIEYVNKRMEIENAITRQLQCWAKKSNYHHLSNRLQLPHDLNSGDILIWLDFIIQIAMKAERILGIDDKAMTHLSKDDPGAYAQALLYRRAYCLKDDAIGDFTDNHLRKWLSDEYSDHAPWLLYVERYSVTPIISRLERVTSIPPKSTKS